MGPVAALWFLPVSVGLFIFAGPVIAKLYGPEFLPAAPALFIMLVGVNVDGVLFWTRAALLSMGEPGYPAVVSLWATVIKYAIVFLLVPAGGYLVLAAAWSLVLVGINALTARRTLRIIRIRESMASE